MGPHAKIASAGRFVSTCPFVLFRVGALVKGGTLKQQVSRSARHGWFFGSRDVEGTSAQWSGAPQSSSARRPTARGGDGTFASSAKTVPEGSGWPGPRRLSRCSSVSERWLTPSRGPWISSRRRPQTLQNQAHARRSNGHTSSDGARRYCVSAMNPVVSRATASPR